MKPTENNLESLESPEASASGSPAVSDGTPMVQATSSAFSPKTDEARKRFGLLHFNKTALITTIIALAIIILLGAGSLLLSKSGGNKQVAASKVLVANNFAVGNLKIGNFPAGQLQLGQVSRLDVNGQLRVSNSVILVPMARPGNVTPGEIYYDQTANQPYYYNGQQFVSLAPSQSVTSVQGQIGVVDFTAGTGVTLSGTHITNSGVTSLNGTSNQVAVSQSTGSVTLSLPQDIAPASKPNFAGITTPTLTARSTDTGLTIGLLTQALALQGSTTTISDSNNGNTTQVVFANPTANHTLTLPDVSGEICTSTNNCSFQSNGSYVNLQAITPGTVQTGNLNISGTAIAGAFSGVGGNLTNLNASNLTSGTVADNRLSANVALLSRNNQVFSGTDSFQPTVGNDSTTFFRIQNAAGSTTLLDVDTVNNRIGVGIAGPAYPLDVVGQVNSSVGYSINGVPICTISGCSAVSGSGNYIQNSVGNQVANFNIQSFLASAVTGIIQGASGQSVDIFDVRNSGNVNLLSVANNGTVSTSGNATVGNNLTINGTSINGLGSSSINFDYGTAGSIGILATNGITLQSQVSSLGSLSLATSGVAQFVGSQLQFYSSPNNSGNIFVLNAGSGTQSTETLNFNGSTALGTLNTPSATLDVEGNVLFKNQTNSATAFQVQNAAGNQVLNADTTNSIVSVKGANSNATTGLELMASTTNFSSNWTGSNWTFGSSSAAHTAGTGNTAAAVYTGFTPTIGITYQITFTFSGAANNGIDSITPNIGGVNGEAIYDATDTSESQILVASTTGSLQFIPTANWTGTITSVSVKAITPTNATLKILNSSGGTSLEVRSSNDVGNTFVGLNAGLNNTNGTYNTALGDQSLQSNTNGILNVALGAYALLSNTTGSYNTALGSVALQNNTIGYNNTAVGYGALYTNTTGYDNTAQGYAALQNNTNGFDNTATGFQALYTNTTGYLNTAMGHQALYSNSSGSYNTSVGFGNLFSNTTGTGNSGLGYFSLVFNTTGSNNSAVGNQALYSNTTGSNNTGIGLSSLFANTTGSNSIGIGVSALQSNTTGSGNVAVGYGAGYTLTTGNANVSGSNNTFLGNYAGPGSATQLQSAAAIGANAVVSQSNALVLGCVSGVNGCITSSSVGIDNAAPAYTLDVGGNINASTNIYVNGVAVCTVSTCAATSGSGSYIQNGTATQSANFNVQAATSGSVSAVLEANVSGIGDILNLRNGSGVNVATVGSTGNALFQASTNSTVAFQIQNSAGSSNLFVADTTNTKIGIGGAPSAGGATLQLTGTLSVSGASTLTGALNANGGITTTSGNLNLNATGSILSLGGSIAIIQKTSNALAIDLATAGTSTLTVKNSNGANVANLSVTGSVNIGSGQAYQVNGTDINTAGSLTNVAYLNGTGPQTFTGNNKFTGTFLDQNTSNSTSAFQIQNASSATLFNVDSSTNLNLITNGDFEGGGTTGWTAKGASTITKDSTNQYQSNSDLSVATTTAANDGVSYAFNFAPSTQYTLSFYAKVASGSIIDLVAGRQDVSGTDITCLTGQTVTTNWTPRFSCTFTTGTTITSSNIFFQKSGASAETFFIDGVQLQTGATLTSFNPGGAIQLAGIVNSPVTFQNKQNSTTAFQIQNATGGSNLIVDTVNNRIGIGKTPVGSQLDVAGTINSDTKISSLIIAAANNLQFTSSSTNNSYMSKNTAVSGTVTINDVVVLNTTPAALDTTTARDNRVFGVATAGQTGGTEQVATYGNFTVNADSAAISVGDQLVTSITSGAVTPDNNATTGILGYALSSKGAGTGTVSVFIKPVNGQYAPRFQNSSNSTTAFQIQNSAGTSNLFNADTTNMRIGIGTAAPGNLLSIGALTTAAGTYQIAVTTGGASSSGIVVQTVAGQSSGNILQAQDSSGAALATIDYLGNLRVKQGTFNGTLTVNGHFITGNTSGSTTATVNGNAGTSGTCSVSGNDTGGQVTLVTGSAAWAAGVQCTVNFSSSYGSAPHPVITSANATDTSAVKPYITSATGNFTINFIAADTAAHTFVLNYFNAQ